MIKKIAGNQLPNELRDVIDLVQLIVAPFKGLGIGVVEAFVNHFGEAYLTYEIGETSLQRLLRETDVKGKITFELEISGKLEKVAIVELKGTRVAITDKGHAIPISGDVEVEENGGVIKMKPVEPITRDEISEGEHALFIKNKDLSNSSYEELYREFKGEIFNEEDYYTPKNPYEGYTNEDFKNADTFERMEMRALNTVYERYKQGDKSITFLSNATFDEFVNEFYFDLYRSKK